MSDISTKTIKAVITNTTPTFKASIVQKGTDGKEIELQVNATHIQWRLADGTWANLVALADLKGADGIGDMTKAVYDIDGNGIVDKASVLVNATENNAKVEALDTGTKVSRNIADTNPALSVDNVLGTGNIQEFKQGGNLVGFIDKNGTIGGGTEQTVTNKNKYYPLLKDILGNEIAKSFTAYWNGSAYATDSSTGFGYNSLRNNTGVYSNGFGNNSLLNNTGAYSSGFGSNALYNNTGAYSSGFGSNALLNNTGAQSNGVGYSALQYNTGANSSGFGFYALYNNTGAQSNGFGHASLQNNTGAQSNGFGSYALLNNTGAYSSGFGSNALLNNTGANNTALGYNSFNAFIPNPAGAKSCDYTAIDTTLKRATVTAHGFGTNGTYTLVNYSTTGTAIGGMPVGTVQIKIIDANTIEFTNGSSLRNITSQGTGTHTFTPSINYSNTTSLGANTQPNRSNQVVLGSTAVDSFRFGGTFRTPASSSDTGVVGEFCYDDTYLYLCVATDTWKKIRISTDGVFGDLYNNYSLPTATDSVLGGVKIGAGINIASGVINANGKQDVTTITADTTSTTPTLSLVTNNEYIFSDDAITTLGITLSSGYTAGFIASIVFVSPASAPTVTLTNTGSYTVKTKGDGTWASLVLTPTASKTVTMIFNYDGINMNVYVSEV